MSAIEGMKCPKCGNAEKFRIGVEALADVTEEGVIDLFEIAWTNSSPCHCAACNHEGLVSDFHEQQVSTIPNILNG